MVLGGVAGAGSVLKQPGQPAARTAGAMSDDVARAEAGTAAKEAEEVAESTAKVSGEQGARSTRLLRWIEALSINGGPIIGGREQMTSRARPLNAESD